MLEKEISRFEEGCLLAETSEFASIRLLYHYLKTDYDSSHSSPVPGSVSEYIRRQSFINGLTALYYADTLMEGHICSLQENEMALTSTLLSNFHPDDYSPFFVDFPGLGISPEDIAGYIEEAKSPFYQETGTWLDIVHDAIFISDYTISHILQDPVLLFSSQRRDEMFFVNYLLHLRTRGRLVLPKSNDIISGDYSLILSYLEKNVEDFKYGLALLLQ